MVVEIAGNLFALLFSDFLLSDQTRYHDSSSLVISSSSSIPFISLFLPNPFDLARCVLFFISSHVEFFNLLVLQLKSMLIKNFLYL